MNQNFTHPKTQLAHRTRREFLNTTASGLGMAALGSMLTADNLINAASVDDAAMSVNPLAPRPSHFDPKAKACIFIFMAGAPSHIDLFDPKPVLRERHGQPLPESFWRKYDSHLSKRIMRCCKVHLTSSTNMDSVGWN